MLILSGPAGNSRASRFAALLRDASETAIWLDLGGDGSESDGCVHRVGKAAELAQKWPQRATAVRADSSLSRLAARVCRLLLPWAAWRVSRGTLEFLNTEAAPPTSIALFDELMMPTAWHAGRMWPAAGITSKVESP